jgi:hypothetical protein
MVIIVIAVQLTKKSREGKEQDVDKKKTPPTRTKFRLPPLSSELPKSMIDVLCFALL